MRPMFSAVEKGGQPGSMLDRESEKRHLERLDEHIRGTRARLEHMRVVVEGCERAGIDASLAREALGTLEDTLAALEQRRLYVVETLRRLRAGDLPS